MNRLSKWIPFGLGARKLGARKLGAKTLGMTVLGATALGVMLISAACGTSSSSSSTTEMRVVHLAPDEQQPLEMLIDNKSIFSSIAYGVPTAFTNVTAINHDLKINLSGTNLLDSPMEPFVAGNSYTYLIVGSTTNGVSIQGNKLTDDHTVPDKGMFKLRVVNGSPDSGAVDVYIVAPNTNFGDPTTVVKPTIGGLASNTPSTYQALASGSYDIYVTPPGDQTCITNPKQPPPPVPPQPYPPSCLINLDGRNNTAVPAFQAGQNRTLIILDQVPGGGSLTTLPMLADLN